MFSPQSLYDTHTFNGPSSGIIQVSRYQKGKTNLDFTEPRDSERQWHQLGHMQVCTSLQTDNRASTPPLSFLQAGCPSCRPTNSVRALKANQSLYISLSTNTLQDAHTDLHISSSLRDSSRLPRISLRRSMSSSSCLTRHHCSASILHKQHIGTNPRCLHIQPNQLPRDIQHTFFLNPEDFYVTSHTISKCRWSL